MLAVTQFVVNQMKVVVCSDICLAVCANVFECIEMNSLLVHICAYVQCKSCRF